MADAVVAVEHRHREQDRGRLVGAEERGGGLGRRRQQHRDAVAALDAVGRQDVGEAVGELLQLAPVNLADVALDVLVDHRELVRRVLVAHVVRDVVALGDPPLVGGDGLFVGGVLAGGRHGEVYLLPAAGRSGELLGRRDRGYARGMRNKATSDLWWKNAVVYCLDVETFLDSDGDGCGDLAGLTDRIDYLAGMGVSCLWLMPFYPSPRRDDGYDISDFYGVDPRFGTHGDFAEMVRTARDRGIRVIVDLVMNHTSDQHPWFQSARAEPGLAVPRLLRLGRREAAGEAGRHRVPRQGELQLGVGRGRRPVLPAPLLLLPARPQHGQPRGPRRDRRRSSASGSSRG